MDKDRDFRLAGLALQSGYVTPEQFATALGRWSVDRDQTFFETLAVIGSIPPQGQETLLGLASGEARDAWPPDARPPLEETLATQGASGFRAPGGDDAFSLGPADTQAIVVGDTGAERATLPPDEDSGTHASIELAQDPHVTRFDPHATRYEPGPADLAGAPLRIRAIGQGDGTSRYTRTKIHAQGGLGVVWVARDQSVGREVALKELRHDRRADARVRAKFLEEARITGQLEHPSIVPIYEVAQDEQTGKPYYTMRFIKGGTLADASNRLRRDRAEGKDDPVAFRGLLGSFLGVCRAVAYAHSKGVIHRDLKGQNVVLGDFGEVIVLDWGLAKVIDRPDDLADGVVDPSLGGDAPQETREGQISGTPTYMAPEQAVGAVSKIDRRSDIYSLGAILYEIVTGKPPFSGSSTANLLKLVSQGELEAPRAVASGVPKALEAICLKAMSRRRRDRYQTAAELADEVERYLADEPVAAYPEPWTARAARRARKHRSAVAAAALLLVGSVLALAVGNVLVGRERDRAEAQREIARTAIDDMYVDVAEQWLEDQSDPQQQKFADRALVAYERRQADATAGPAPEADEPAPGPGRDRVDAVQQSFLDRSLAYYEDFATQPTDDLRSSLGAAQARIRIANIRRKLGKVEDAGRDYRRAIADLDALTLKNPQDAMLARARAIARGRLGAMLVTQGKFAEADPLLAQAEETYRGLVASPSAVDRDRLEWGRLLREQAERLKLAGKTGQAEARFRLAIAELAKLVAGKSPGVEARHELALAQDALGVMLLLALDRQDDAAKLLQNAMALEEKLVDEAPTVPHLRAGLGKTGNTLSLILRADGKTADALKVVGVALANYRRLADDFPGRTEYRRWLARTFLNRGNLEQDDGRIEDAASSYDQSAGLLAGLVKESPEVVKHHRDLGYALNNLAAMRERQETIEAAIASYRQAEAIDRKLADRFPGVPEYLESLAIDRRNLARALSKSGRPADFDEAARLGRAALAAFQGLATSHPQVTSYQRGLAESRFQLGSIEVAAGHAKEAETLLRQAVAGFRDLKPQNLGVRRSLVDALGNLAEVAGDDAEALDREALALAEALCNDPKASTGDRFARAAVVNNLGEIVARKGRGDEADRLFTRSEALFREKGLGGGEPQRLHYLAYVLTNRGKLADKQGRPADALVRFREALDRDREATKQVASYQTYLRDDYDRLGTLLIQIGNHREAAELAFEMVGEMPDLPSARVEAAGLLARCADVARKEATGSESTRAALVKSYTAKGIAQLRVALDSGYKQIDAIKGHAHLKGLLQESESRDLLPDLFGVAEGTGG